MDWAVTAGRSANNSVAWVAAIRGHAGRTALTHSRSSGGHHIDPEWGNWLWDLGVTDPQTMCKSSVRIGFSWRGVLPLLAPTPHCSSKMDSYYPCGVPGWHWSSHQWPAVRLHGRWMKHPEPNQQCTCSLVHSSVSFHPPECHKSACFPCLLGESQSDTVVCHCQVFIMEYKHKEDITGSSHQETVRVAMGLFERHNLWSAIWGNGLLLFPMKPSCSFLFSVLCPWAKAAFI